MLPQHTDDLFVAKPLALQIELPQHTDDLFVAAFKISSGKLSSAMARIMG